MAPAARWIGVVGPGESARAVDLAAAEDKPAGPSEARFERDYAAPTFKPAWKRQRSGKGGVREEQV